MTKKDKKIIEKAEKENIPIFVFIANDKLSVNALIRYNWECKGANCSTEHIEGVRGRIDEFAEYQASNPDSVKLPD